MQKCLKFYSGWSLLGWAHPKSTEDKYTKLCRLIVIDFKKGEKVILKLLFPIRRWDLIKKS